MCVCLSFFLALFLYLTTFESSLLTLLVIGRSALSKANYSPCWACFLLTIESALVLVCPLFLQRSESLFREKQNQTICQVRGIFLQTPLLIFISSRIFFCLVLCSLLALVLSFGVCQAFLQSSWVSLFSERCWPAVCLQVCLNSVLCKLPTRKGNTFSFVFSTGHRPYIGQHFWTTHQIYMEN